MSTSPSIRKSATWLFLSSAGQQLLTFFFGVALARLLAPEDFGILLAIQVFTGLAGFIAGGGMGRALVRAKTVTTQDYEVVFTLQLLIGCLIYASFFALAPWFARWYERPIYTDLLRISAISFLLRPFVNLPSNILQRGMRFGSTAIASLCALVAGSTASVAMAWHGFEVWSLVWGGLAGSLVNAIGLGAAAGWRPRLSFEFRRGKTLAKYGLMISLNDIVFYARSQVSIFVLSHSAGPASVGLYNKGESLARMPHQFITGSLYPVLFRALAKEQDSLAESRRLFLLGVALVAVLATPFYVGLLWMAEPLIKFVFGPKWTDATGPLTILTAAWPFWLIGNLSGNVLGARNLLARELAVQICTLVVTVVAVLIALPWGIKGVAWAVVASAAFAATWQLLLVTRCLEAQLRDVFGALVPALALNALLACSLLFFDKILPDSIHRLDRAYLTVMALAGMAVYVAAFLFLPLGGIRDEQNRWKKVLKVRVRELWTR